MIIYQRNVLWKYQMSSLQYWHSIDLKIFGKNIVVTLYDNHH